MSPEATNFSSYDILQSEIDYLCPFIDTFGSFDKELRSHR
jgi:hypothetical protein